MNRVLRKSSGGLLLAVAVFLFIVFTASINSAQSAGGPMNMSPSSEEWFYIVLVLDVLFLLAGVGGIRLLGIKGRTVGMLCISVGVAILILGVKNHTNAPPLDGINDSNMIPVPPFLHYAVYSFVVICLMGGTWLVTTGLTKEGLR